MFTICQGDFKPHYAFRSRSTRSITGTIGIMEQIEWLYARFGEPHRLDRGERSYTPEMIRIPKDTWWLGYLDEDDNDRLVEYKTRLDFSDAAYKRRVIVIDHYMTAFEFRMKWC